VKVYSESATSGYQLAAVGSESPDLSAPPCELEDLPVTLRVVAGVLRRPVHDQPVKHEALPGLHDREHGIRVRAQEFVAVGYGRMACGGSRGRISQYFEDHVLAADELAIGKALQQFKRERLRR
jgi:hypothetical protein